MKKELGVHPYLFPMPVLMIATYGDDDTVDVMNMAWGGICAENMVSLNIDEGHKTSENIKKRGAFTLSIADIPHIEAADFFGIASGNKMANKFERSGLTAVKSEKVDAPIVQEFPLTLECMVSGMRAACGSLMIAEMMGVESGLAWYITWQRGWGNFTKMYTAVVMICITFLFVDAALGLLRRRILRWEENADA